MALARALRLLQVPPPSPAFRRRLQSPLRLLSVSVSFPSPEDAAAERRRRRRRLRMDPPPHAVRHHQPQRPFPPRNPNTPKLPEPHTALSGKRLELHNRILALIRAGDLDEAALLTRHSIYSNCRPTVFTCNAVMAAQIRQLRHSDMLSLHRFVTQAGVAPSVATHNLLLQAYCDARRTDAALDHLRLMLDSSPVSPSPSTFRILARALVRDARLDDALHLRSQCPTPDPAVYNTLMAALLPADPDRALALHDELRRTLPASPPIVLGSLINAYLLKGMHAEAMAVYSDALRAAPLNPIAANFILEALHAHSKHDEATWLFRRMTADHSPPRRLALNLGSFNVMVDGLCTQRRYGEAVELFRGMGEWRCVPDALSYNNLIGHLGRNGQLAAAEEMYQEMGGKGVAPDEYTHVLMVEACFREGGVEGAVGYFARMLELGLRPSANAFNRMIGGMVDAARIEDARGYFDRMAEREVKPNAESYSILVKAYCKLHRVEEALGVFKLMLMDDGVVVAEEVKELVGEAMKREGREEGELGKFYEDVEREKAEALARAEEERARAEAAAREEEERKKAEANAKAEAAAKASRAALEALMANKKLLRGAEGRDESKVGDRAENGSASAVVEGLGLNSAEQSIMRRLEGNGGSDEEGNAGDESSSESSCGSLPSSACLTSTPAVDGGWH